MFEITVNILKELEHFVRVVDGLLIQALVLFCVL